MISRRRCTHLNFEPQVGFVQDQQVAFGELQGRQGSQKVCQWNSGFTS